MTAVLEEIRRLEAARLRGDIKHDEFRRLRASLLAAIEDAEIVEAPRADPDPTGPAPQLWVLAFALGAAAGIFTLVAGWLIGDATLALTLAATLLAAVAVAAYRRLEAREALDDGDPDGQDPEANA